jgi:hypothetical protein
VAKPTSTAKLEGLRHAAVAARGAQRDAEVVKAGAVRAADAARSAVIEAYADENDREVKAAEARRDAADRALRDADLKAAGARLRVHRAKSEADEFEIAHAHDLIEEREHAVAEALRLLNEGISALIAGDKLWNEEAGRIGRLLPHATGDPRAEVVSGHGFEQIVRDLRRRRESQEVQSPMPNPRPVGQGEARGSASGGRKEADAA